MYLATVIPIASIMPASVVAPVTVLPAPAPFSLFVEFMMRALGLRTAFAMPGNCTVKFGLCLLNVLAALAMFFVSPQLWNAGKEEQGAHGCDSRSQAQRSS